MDKFTSSIEELNSKFSNRTISASQQNLAVQAEACNGSLPTSLFVTGLGNGSLTGSLMPHSSSSSQLARESPLMEEVASCPSSNPPFCFSNLTFFYQNSIDQVTCSGSWFFW